MKGSKYMKKVLLALAAVLVLLGGGIWYGGRFATNMVNSQLVQQKIFFPASAAQGLPANLQQYAGQQVDNGQKAEAFANKYIQMHLQKSGGGKTYSEVSAAYLKDPTNTTLAQTRQTLFMGETLRGILLNAWGWGLVGMIATLAGMALVALGAIVALVALSGLVAPKKTTKKSKK
jgi:hypothetical protein